jgi:hypothetical protein
MIKFDTQTTSTERAGFHGQDFLICEDDLPSAVILTEEGPLSRATRMTEVKHETTDDN